MAIEDIPGGAATQVAEASGNPSAVGLSGAQLHQAELGTIPKEPIPVYDESLPMEWSEDANVNAINSGMAPEIGAEPQPDIEADISTPKSRIAPRMNRGLKSPEVNPVTGKVSEIDQPRPNQEYPVVDPSTVETNTFSVVVPDGSEVEVTVPTSWGEWETKHMLAEQGVKGLEITEGDMALERFEYEFAKGDNITTNVGDYMKSHLPFLVNEIRYDNEGGLHFLDAGDIYGEDYYDLSPQERRERIKKIDLGRVNEEYAEAAAVANMMKSRGESDVAGGFGMVAKGIADPAAFVPIAGQAGKLAKGYKAVSATGAKVGAGWGAAYGGSKVLAKDGAPMTKEEYLEAGKTIGTDAAIGAVGGAVLSPVIKGVARVATSKNKIALQTIAGAKKLNDKYYAEVWRNQSIGMSAGEAGNAAQKTLKLSTDDVWQMKVKADDLTRSPAYSAGDAKERLTKAGLLDNWRDTSSKNRVVQAFDNLLQPIDAGLRQRSAWVAQRVKNLDANVLRRVRDYHEEMRPFIQTYNRWAMNKGLNKEDKISFDLALRNQDFKAAREIFATTNKTGNGRRNSMDVFDDMARSLRKLKKEMEDAGIKVETLDDYFPRQVKSHTLQELKDFLNSNRVTKTGWRRELRNARAKAGRELSGKEEERILNRWMQTGTGRIAKSAKATKERTVQVVTRDMDKFYDNSVTALDLHIRDSINALERYKLFGKNMAVNEHGVENIDESIGKWLIDNNVSADTIDGIKPLLRARFGKGEESGSGMLATMRQGVGGVTLGNPLSALRQLGDNFVAATYYGIIPTMQSMPRAAWQTTLATMGIRNHKGFSADMAGFMADMAQELDTGGVASNMIKRTATSLYKYSGFKTVDRLGKNVLIGTAIRSSRKMQNTVKGRQEFMRKFGTAYDAAEIKMLMADLKSGKWSEIVKQHIVSEVMEIQPISRSQMPAAYLNHPNGRMLYQFRTWGIKQMNMARERIFKDMFSKDPKRIARGSKTLMLMTAYIGTGNVAITELQRWVTGRDSRLFDINDFANDSIEQLMGNIGMNRYGMDKLAQEGDVDTFINGFVPPSLSIPMEMGTSMYKALTAEDDAEQAKWTKKLRKTTGIGRIVDLWAFGGAEEENQKIYDEFKAGMSQSQ